MAKSVTIAELTEGQKKLESMILSRLNAFEETFGVSVVHIQVQRQAFMGKPSLVSKMASIGHCGTQRLQSMQTSLSMTSMFGPSWKHSTGHTSTQSVSLHLMQLSVTTNAIYSAYHLARSSRKSFLAIFNCSLL